MEQYLGVLILVPMVGAFLSFIIGEKSEKIRDYFAIGITALTFLLVIFTGYAFLKNGTDLVLEIKEFCGFGLHLKLDGFRFLYAAIASFAWLVSTAFSQEYFAHYGHKNRYYFFLLTTLSATLGVFLSADFFTLFLFFEIMSFTSYVWVAQDEKKASLRAAATYLTVAVLGGLVMLMGIFLLYHLAGTLYFDELVGLSQSYPGKELWIAGFCMFFGFGAKAGAFPLHIWLPKAHPVAPAPASALLSGILTKAGIYGVLLLTGYLFLGETTWGAFVLVLGVITMVLGAFLALCSIDLKRTLACSSVSQIGFILVAIGMSGLLGEENLLAVQGAMLHMVNHSLLKLVLFLAAGIVFMNLHQLDLNEIQGFGKHKPFLALLFVFGALGLGGVPLFNGYISKTLIHESMVEYMELCQEGLLQPVFSFSVMKTMEWIFLCSGGLTVAYMTKLCVVLFVQDNNNAQKQQSFQNQNYIKPVSAIGLCISAILLPVLGAFPAQTMGKIAALGETFMGVEEVPDIAYFSLQNLKGSFISIAIGVVIYLLLVPTVLQKKTAEGKMYINPLPPYFDLENSFYRPLLLVVLPSIARVLCRFLDCLVDSLVVFLRHTIFRDSALPHELEEGTWLTDSLGKLLNAFQTGLFSGKKEKRQTIDYRHKLALMHRERIENQTIINRSLSYGLMLFCIGLMITVAYLLISLSRG